MSDLGFTSIEHAVATVTRDTVVGARAGATYSAKLSTAEPTIEEITALVDSRPP
jgi:hypothetical protein